MAHDPGPKNYGLAVLRVELDLLDKSLSKKERREEVLNSLPFSIVHLEKLETRYTDLKSPGKIERETAAYTKTIHALCKKHSVDVQIAERYMSRRMGGVTIELVNMMLGSLRTLSNEMGKPIKLIPASQWKNELKRREVDLELLYRFAKGYKVSDHEVDAVMIALYGVFILMRRLPYSMHELPELINAVAAKVARVAESRH